MTTQKIVNVNGTDYIINAFTSDKGLPLLARVTKIFGPVVAEMMKAKTLLDDEGNPIVDEDGSLVEDIDFGSLFQTLFFEGTEGVVALVNDLIRDVSKGGVTINIGKEFQLNYVAMLELAVEVVKFNFKDVFQRLGFNFQ